MAYVNVGAKVNGERPRTKKALKEAMAAHPETVLFDRTAAFEGRGPIRGDELPEDTLQVVGPDPYTNRKWYASIKNGKVT